MEEAPFDEDAPPPHSSEEAAPAAVVGGADALAEVAELPGSGGGPADCGGTVVQGAAPQSSVCERERPEADADGAFSGGPPAGPAADGEANGGEVGDPRDSGAGACTGAGAGADPDAGGGEEGVDRSGLT